MKRLPIIGGYRQVPLRQRLSTLSSNLIWPVIEIHEISRTRYALDSGSPYRLCFGTERGLRGVGDRGVSRRAGIDRLLCETEKQLAAALGFSPVKAKGKLIQAVRQMLV